MWGAHALYVSSSCDSSKFCTSWYYFIYLQTKTLQIYWCFVFLVAWLDGILKHEWGGRKMVSCVQLRAATVDCFVLSFLHQNCSKISTSGLPDLGVLFSFFASKLLKNIHPRAATASFCPVINLPCGPSVCRKGFTFSIVLSNVHLLFWQPALVLPVVCKIETEELEGFGFFARIFASHFYSCDWRGRYISLSKPYKALCLNKRDLFAIFSLSSLSHNAMKAGRPWFNTILAKHSLLEVEQILFYWIRYFHKTLYCWKNL